MGARKPRGGNQNLVMPVPPNQGGGDIGVGGGPGIPPRFPDQVNDPRFRRRQRKKEKREVFAPGFPSDGPRILPIFPGGGRRKVKAGRRRMMPPRGPVTGPGFPSDGPSIMPIPPRPLTGGYNPKSGVRYTDQGVPTAVQETKRIPVQDPTLGGPPEREVPIAKERIRPITRESDPRGPAPFAPDEKGMARDRFFERVFEKADEAKQRKSMQKEERREVRQARNEERRARRMQPGEIDVGGEIDINAERGGRRRRGGMKRRRGRRRDFTRRRSQMEGGRRGRSGREMAEFRDRYVSTLR